MASFNVALDFVRLEQANDFDNYSTAPPLHQVAACLDGGKHARKSISFHKFESWSV